MKTWRAATLCPSRMEDYRVKPCTCKSFSGGTVVQPMTVGSAASGRCESFANLLCCVGWVDEKTVAGMTCFGDILIPRVIV